MPNVIKLVTHPQSYELRQARLDYAHITGQPMIERPYYFENTETGQQYYGLYGCVGWPTKDTEKTKGQPGYVAVVGVVKSERPIQKSWFKLMGEGESEHIPVLLDSILRLREQFGFGTHPELLQHFTGDCDKETINTIIALRNEELLKKDGTGTILISPPNDFGTPDTFDTYKRSFDWSITCSPALFAPGSNSILRVKHQEYHKDNPAILAIGGLIHWLLTAVPWMEQSRSNCFVLEEG
jgi:hypothetical protein